MLHIIQTSFGARPVVDPPPAALSDTVEQVAQRIVDGAGIIASVGGVDAACLLISYHPQDANWPRSMSLHRVSVLPEFQHRGLASAIVRAAVELGADAGWQRLTLLCRREFPELRRWWMDHGFVVDREVELGYVMGLRLPTAVQVPTGEDMRRLGERLAGLLRAGDLIVVNGELGAGKTTLAQGVGRGLGVQGPVISPTFVLARIHPSAGPGPALVHVDAYRLGSAAELEDIDLDASMAESVTLVEWGAGLVEGLSPDRLDIDIRRSGDPDDQTRTVYLAGLGPRWADVDLTVLQGSAA